MLRIVKKVLNYLLVNYAHFLSNERCLALQFRLNTGYKLNLQDPKTFNEKLQWLKLYNYRAEYTNLVDKYEVRKYIAKTIGSQYLIPLLGVYDRFEDIDFNKLPGQFVLKCTHDSGGIVICKDKTKFNLGKARRKINRCLKRNFYYIGRELVYKEVRPRIVVEKFMTDDRQKTDLIDYKFMCFNGQPRCVFTCSERYTQSGLKVTFFDMHWKRLPFIRHYPASARRIVKPHNYATMLRLTKKLVQKTTFLRVDWYEINNKIYFGELTFYPGSGFEEFRPAKWDRVLGDWIDLKQIKRSKK